MTNIISILVQKSLNSYDYLFSSEFTHDNVNLNENFIIEHIERPSKATMKINENSSNNDSANNLQKTFEEKKIEKQRKEIIQMDFHRLFCKKK